LATIQSILLKLPHDHYHNAKSNENGINKMKIDASVDASWMTDFVAMSLNP
jgi:hypothetical protein